MAHCPAVIPVLGRDVMSVPAPCVLRHSIYVPTGSWGQPPLVVVHGSGRHATRAFQSFLPAALALGMPLLTPRFPREEHGSYQTLGGSASPLAAERALDATLAEARRCGGLAPGPVHLLGFSGGAQFAHRFALLRPERVARLTVVSAGWYTWLDPARPFPTGIAPSAVSAQQPFDVEGFLAVPVHVMVGARDTEQDDRLRRSDRLDEEQGTNRMARAVTWSAHLEDTARAYGAEPRVSCTLLPDTGHSWREAVERGGLVGRALGLPDDSDFDRVRPP